MQESLETEVARLSGLSAVSANAPVAPIDSTSARSAGKAAGADVVVFGAEQYSGQDVRFTGQVVDVKSGAALGGIKASGDFRDLFELEDELSAQLSRALRPPPPMSQVATNNDSLILTQPVTPLQADTSTDPTLADAYYRYYYDTTSYYPFFYGGGYPFYGGGIGYGGYGYGGFGYGFGRYGGYGGIRFGGGARGRHRDQAPPVPPPAAAPVTHFSGVISPAPRPMQPPMMLGAQAGQPPLAKRPASGAAKRVFGGGAEFRGFRLPG